MRDDPSPTEKKVERGPPKKNKKKKLTHHMISWDEFFNQTLTEIKDDTIPKNLRRQAKAIFVWYPKERADLKMIHDENNVLTDDELVIVRDFLRMSKHACLYIQNEHSRGFNVLNRT